MRDFGTQNISRASIKPQQLNRNITGSLKGEMPLGKGRKESEKNDGGVGKAYRPTLNECL